MRIGRLACVAILSFSQGCAENEAVAPAELPAGFSLAGALTNIGPEYLRAVNVAETQVQKCMNQAGWQYTPSDNSAFLTPSFQFTDVNRVEFATKFGYEQAVVHLSPAAPARPL